jgi:trigger factor
VELNVDKTATAVAKISFSVPAAELEAELDRGLKSVSRNVRMKGFRPGKVPRKVVEKAYGENLRQEVIGRFINQAYQRAVKEHELRPLAHPRLGADALRRGEDGSISAEFEVPLRPSFELPGYTGLQVTSELEPVMDQQVEAALDEFRDSQATPEKAGEDGLRE